jgi:hypothetical protein
MSQREPQRRPLVRSGETLFVPDGPIVLFATGAHLIDIDDMSGGGDDRSCKTERVLRRGGAFALVL